MGKVLNKTKGEIKQAVGDLTGNDGLKRQGQRDELIGKVEGGIADVKEAVKSVGDKIKDGVK